MTVPYLIDFTPYKFEGEQCQSINDMVSVNITQRSPIMNIPYEIGSLDDILLPISIKNLTNNVKLEVNIEIDKNIFITNNQKLKFTLTPEQTITTTLSLNKDRLDETITKLQSSVKITVKNIRNGTIVTRNTPVSFLPPVLLEETIEIIP